MLVDGHSLTGLGNHLVGSEVVTKFHSLHTTIGEQFKRTGIQVGEELVVSLLLSHGYSGFGGGHSLHESPSLCKCSIEREHGLVSHSRSQHGSQRIFGLYRRSYSHYIVGLE